MPKIEFVGFPHTETYQGGEIKSPIKAGDTAEVSAAEAKRLEEDFKEAGPGKKPAFKVVK